MICCIEEVLDWFVSHMRHKPPHAHTAVYLRVLTIWSVPKGSLLKCSFSVGSYPGVLNHFLPFCAFTQQNTPQNPQSLCCCLVVCKLQLAEICLYSTPAFNLEWYYVKHMCEIFTIWHLHTRPVSFASHLLTLCGTTLWNLDFLLSCLSYYYLLLLLFSVLSQTRSDQIRLMFTETESGLKMAP